MFEDIGQLFAEEDRDNGRRGFVGAKPVVIAGAGGGGAQQVGIIVNGLDNCAKEDQELDVIMRGFSGFEQVLAVIGGHRPVIMFAGAVDAGKRFFVQKADQSMAEGDFFHGLHRQLIMVGGDVGGRKDRGEFMLGRGDLVVLGLGGDAELPQLHIQVGHESRDSVLESGRSNGLPVPAPWEAWRRTACGR